MNEGASDRWASPNTVLFLAITFVSSAAFGAQATALGKAVFDLTGREWDLGLLGLAEFLPAAALVVVAGSLSDRVDRRWLMAGALAAEGACSIGLYSVVTSARPTLGAILGWSFGFGAARAFLAPASRSLPVFLVGAAAFPRLIGTFTMVWQAATIVGPVAGGMLYARAPGDPFVACAALTLAAAIGALFLTTRTRPLVPMTPVAPKGWRSALDGLRVVRSNRILAGAISLDLFAVLFGGAVALLPVIADTRLGVGATGLGWLRAAAGIGAATVALTVAARPLRRRIGRSLFVAVAVFGVATVCLGVTTNYVVAFASLVVLGGADAVSVFIRSTLVPLASPEHVRGRVAAVENVFIGASNELGAFESGAVGQLLGAPGAIVLGGVATVAVAVAWSKGFPELGEMDRFPEPLSEPHTTGSDRRAV